MCQIMPHAFNQNELPFGQCEHFNQVEPFEKPWFLVMPSKDDKTITYSKNDFLDNVKSLDVQVLSSFHTSTVTPHDMSPSTLPTRSNKTPLLVS